jgi:hypothetical protein
VCLLEEYCKGGSLDDLLYGNRLRPHRKARRLEYSDILHIATDVSAAMAYLHPSIVHRGACGLKRSEQPPERPRSAGVSATLFGADAPQSAARPKE